jgi:hypothetical protein
MPGENRKEQCLLSKFKFVGENQHGKLGVGSGIVQETKQAEQTPNNDFNYPQRFRILFVLVRISKAIYISSIMITEPRDLVRAKPSRRICNRAFMMVQNPQTVLQFGEEISRC